MKKKAVILYSGGLDSTTCLALALSKGFECYTASFNYGQKHSAELQAAAKNSAKMGAKLHHIFDLQFMGKLEHSALVDPNMAIPDYIASEDIPVTYVPARNTIFLSIALGWAEALQAHDIYIGVSSKDYSHYPDCRPKYVKHFEELMNLATKDGVEGRKFTLHAPLVNLTKAQTIELGLSLGVNYGETISCYRANEKGQACGTCDSCTFRKKGFHELDIPDPTAYW